MHWNMREEIRTLSKSSYSRDGISRIRLAERAAALTHCDGAGEPRLGTRPYAALHTMGNWWSVRDRHRCSGGDILISTSALQTALWHFHINIHCACLWSSDIVIYAAAIICRHCSIGSAPN